MLCKTCHLSLSFKCSDRKLCVNGLLSSPPAHGAAITLPPGAADAAALSKSTISFRSPTNAFSGVDNADFVFMPSLEQRADGLVRHAIAETFNLALPRHPLKRLIAVPASCIHASLVSHPIARSTVVGAAQHGCGRLYTPGHTAPAARQHRPALPSHPQATCARVGSSEVTVRPPAQTAAPRPRPRRPCKTPHTPEASACP